MKCNDVGEISWDEKGLHGTFTVKVEEIQPDEFFSLVSMLRGCLKRALEQPAVKPRKLDKVLAAAAKNSMAMRWSREEIGVIKHCPNPEAAWSAYHSIFAGQTRSEGAVRQKWTKLHVKVKSSTVKPAAAPPTPATPEVKEKILLTDLDSGRSTVITQVAQFKVGDRVKQIAGAFMTNETGTIVTVRADKAHVNFKGVPHWLLFTEMEKVTEDANV